MAAIRTQALKIVDPRSQISDAQYEELTKSLEQMLSTLADGAGITNDPQLGSDLLSDAMVLTPHLFSRLSHIARLDTVLLLSQGEKISHDDREDMRYSYVHILFEDEHLRDYLSRADESDVALPPIEEYHKENIKPKLDLLSQSFDTLFEGAYDRKTIALIGETAADLIRAYDIFYDSVSDRFLELLLQRNEELRSSEILVLIFSSLAFSGMLGLFVILYRSLVRTEEAEQRAAAASQIKSEFLANMSHELRTPLNSIIGMSRLLSESSPQGEPRDLAQGVFQSSINLLEIVNDILDLSKIEAGEMRLETVGFDALYVLHSVIDTLEHTARDKRLKIVEDHRGPFPPYFMGDPMRLGRIFFNLIGNALKYTERGTVTVRTSNWPLSPDVYRFRFEVEDTGIGIAENKLGIIFDKFVQADTSTTRKYGGTGLGLAICKDLVALMGGDIGVTSKEGVGSLFWVEIPFTITDVLQEQKYHRHRHVTKAEIPAQTARILVAEDHQMNQMLIEKLLHSFGLQHLVIVDNGVKALNAYKQQEADLILMDCHMPQKNGYDTTMEIRASEKGTGTHIPIIAMTANAMVGDREKCLRSGMDDYISKPINANELKDIIAQWIKFPVVEKQVKEAPDEGVLDLSALRSFTDGDVEKEKELMALFIKRRFN